MAKITVYPWNEWGDTKLRSACGVIIGAGPKKNEPSGKKEKPSADDPDGEKPGR